MATSLVALPAVERLSPRCIRILGGNPGKYTLQGTNTYLLGTGPRRILIDTGEGKPAWLSSLKETLEQENAIVESALITHWHGDHVGGISDLLKVSPNASIYKNTPDDSMHDIKDGQVFATQGVTLTAFHTPGHTKDHMVFTMVEEDAMFTADNVLGQGTAVFEDLSDYMRSLAKMKTLFKGRAYPGHGPVLEDGPSKIIEYIEHRRQREQQVLDTLRLGREDGEAGRSWTPMELVQVIYKEVPQALHAAACGGLVQTLGKLEEEGKVVRTGKDDWRLAEGRSSL
ncbi:metallo-beta-lactamase superfamily protein [Sarocladium implicatum]|nr:metallo-beta-lactamase superfamily protein [Sarocladium implicatum]